MLAKVAEFRWQVFAGGYAVNGEKTRCLNPNEGVFAPITDRYPLEEDPTLFRKFAATEPTEAGVVSFANQWGSLRSVQDFWEESFTYTSEPTELWFKEIRKMKALVDLWDVLKGAKEMKLADVIEVDKEDFQGDLNGRIAFKQAPDLFWSFFFRKRDKPGGIHELARMCLLELINDSLWGFCSPWLNMGKKPEENTLCLTPHNLDAAMWLMFAQEILGEKKLKQCQFCKGYFEVSEENERRQRSDKKYCSPKCRAGAFRERVEATAQKQARKKNKNHGEG